MANSHVLEQIEPGKYRIVHHLPIPAANNPAGVPYRTILAAEVAARVAQAGGRASVLPDGDGTAGTISLAEKNQIISGAIHELVREEAVSTMPELVAQFDRRKVETLADLQLKYARYGTTV